MSRLIIISVCLFYIFTTTLSSIIGGRRDLFRSSITEKAVHQVPNTRTTSKASADEFIPDFWIENAQDTLSSKLSHFEDLNKGIAKNIIMFLGDGMSLPTVATARIYKGQKEGKSGEEQKLSFEEFPHVGLSKTYAVNYQVTDSAASATAYLTGVKGNYGTIGVTANVNRGNCTEMLNRNFQVSSIAEWAQRAGKRTGFVTTARITHASPAPLYSHAADRDWECDTDVRDDDEDPNVCQDIAHQLIHNEIGQKLNVIMGGGKKKFLPSTTLDEYGKKGGRSDGENLIDSWKNYKSKSSDSHAYVYNRNGLLNLTNEDYVLGLFTRSHMTYELDRDAEIEPSIGEMTKAAIQLLSKGENGFFLFVEGARIDMAHHDLIAMKSLEETVAFAEAVSVGVSMTDTKDTLIVVTSDHSHTLSFNGYPKRGSDILTGGGTGDDGLPYLTLSYSNGFDTGLYENGTRRNVYADPDFGTKDYAYPGMVIKDSETHGGDDVGIFAIGPWAHLFTGVNEQNVIPHLMAYAACIGSGRIICSKSPSPIADDNSGSFSIRPNLFLLYLTVLLFTIVKRSR